MKTINEEKEIEQGEIKKVADSVNSAATQEDLSLMEAMLKAGVAFGHKKSKTNPKMAPYILMTRNEIQIIDLEKTLLKLKKAAEFLRGVFINKGKILFVGTIPSAKELIKETAKELKMPYVNGRWIGGLITNFQTIKKRIEYFIDLEKKKETGELEKYTKKERLLFDRELAKLETSLGGVKMLEKIPDAIFIIDIKVHDTVVREAKIAKIPTVALVDTNTDPTDIIYPIPSNDSVYSTIKFMLGYIKDELLKSTNDS